MAFILRRPFTVTAILRQISKPTHSSFRAFHSAAKPISKSRAAAPSLSQSQNVFRATFRRRYQQAAYNPVAQGDLKQRLIYGAGIFGATLLGINLVFNRETREDGGMPPYEREYLNDSAYRY